MAEPPITRQAAHDSGPGNLPPTRVVIHATCPDIGFPAASMPGRAASTAAYFASPASGGSAHYVCDPHDEQHCVPDAHIAWGAPPNPHSLHIEVCAEGGDYPRNYTRAQWLSPLVWPAVERAAARTAELCARFDIPTVRLSVADLLAGRHGICGHVDVSHAWHETSHSDPGPQFPWTEFLAAVTGAPLSPAPVVTAHRKDDPVSPIPFVFASGGWFAGVKVESPATGSSVVRQQWITYGPIFGNADVIITALDGAGRVIDRLAGSGDEPAHPVGVVKFNNRDYVYEVPPAARTVTVEGRGGSPVAALITLPL